MSEAGEGQKCVHVFACVYVRVPVLRPLLREASLSVLILARPEKTRCEALETWPGRPVPLWQCDLEQGFALYNLLVKSVMGRNVLQAEGVSDEHWKDAQVQAEGSAEVKDHPSLPSCLGLL